MERVLTDSFNSMTQDTVHLLSHAEETRTEPGNGELTEIQREAAAASANLIVATVVRLEMEHGEAAALEALRLVLSAVPADQTRQLMIDTMIAAERELH